MDNEFKLVWVVCKLLYAITYTLEQADVLLDKPETLECAVHIETCYINDPQISFASIHPCAWSRLPDHRLDDGPDVVSPASRRASRRYALREQTGGAGDLREGQ